MAKPLPQKPLAKVVKPEKDLIPEKYQDVVFIILLFLFIFIFFSSAIFGGGFNADDNIASASFRNYLDAASKQGTFPLWIPNIFGGMPSFASLLCTGTRVWDLIGQLIFGILWSIGYLFSNDTARVVTYYFIYALGIYILMRTKDHERFVAFLTAFAAVFSTYVITWVMIGHNTKPVVLCTFPFILLLMEQIRQKFNLLYAVLLAVAAHLVLEGGQQQIAFYAGCIFGIYLIYELLSRIILKNKPLTVFKPAIFLVLAFGIGFLMSADRYLSVLEYTPYSTRGSAPIVKTEKQHQDESGGNDYDYATMWSYSPQEAITFLVPGYFGHGIRDVQNSSGKGESYKVPTYWGQKESEDSPPYMGIIVLGFAVLGVIIFRRDIFVQCLFIIAIFSLFLSFGKNFPLLYNLFYNYIPVFNKFRAPSMALAMMHFVVPILAGYGLTGILKWKDNLNKENQKLLYGTLAGAGLFLIVGLFFAIGFKNSYQTAVTESGKVTRLVQYFPDIVNNIWNMALSDWLINAVLACGAAALIYYFVKMKITKWILYIGLMVILVFDLWRVDWRRMEVSKSKIDKEVFSQYDALYRPLQKEMESGVFRIFDPNSNIPANFMMQTINGYHSAKMRIYQDLMDVANKQGYEGSTSILYNPFLWNLMNVKYIIMPEQSEGGKQGKPKVYPNPEVLPRAFFVSHTAIASQMDILMHLKNGDFNPKDTAFLEEQLPQSIDTAGVTDTAKILEYKNEYISIAANASGNNLLFISEIYYPAGWKAFIDGNETQIYKTDFAFRSVIVPRGSHKVEFKFHSEKFELGKSLSLISNIIVILGAIVGVALIIIKKKKSN